MNSNRMKQSWKRIASVTVIAAAALLVLSVFPALRTDVRAQTTTDATKPAAETSEGAASDGASHMEV